MKITLDVNEGDVGKSVAELMGALTPDEKREIARQTMLEFLKDPIDAERNAYSQEVIARILKEDAGSSYGPKTRDEAEQDYRFRDRMKEYKSTKEKMVKAIVSETVGHYETVVEELVKQDPQIIAMKDEVIKIVRETLPSLIQQGIVAWVAQHLSVAISTALTSEVNLKNIAELQQRMNERLVLVASRVGI